VRADIGRENISASILTPAEAQYLFARCADLAIEGGRAAVLRPRARRRLIAAGLSMGLPPFKVNILVATAQEAARTGVLPEAVVLPLPPAREPTPRASRQHLRASIVSFLFQAIKLTLITLALAAAIAGFLAAWVISARR
jgi:hypothetical protein